MKERRQTLENQGKVKNAMLFFEKELSNGYLPCPVDFIVERTSLTKGQVDYSLKALREKGFCKSISFKRSSGDDPRLESYNGYVIVE